MIVHDWQDSSRECSMVRSYSILTIRVVEPRTIGRAEPNSTKIVSPLLDL